MDSDHAPVADPEGSLEPPLRQNYSIFNREFSENKEKIIININSNPPL